MSVECSPLHFPLFLLCCKINEWKKISKVAEKAASIGGIETSKPDTLSLAKPNLLT